MPSQGFPEKRRTVLGCRDKVATERLARKLQDDAHLRRHGVDDPALGVCAAAELKSLKRQLQDLDRPQRQQGIDVDQVVKNVVSRLNGLCDRLGELPNAEMKRLLAAMIRGLEIDLETDELTFTVVLPDSMALPMLPNGNQQPLVGADDGAKVRLDCPLPWSSSAETKGSGAAGNGIPLSHWGCRKADNRYTCSRRGRAA